MYSKKFISSLNAEIRAFEARILALSEDKKRISNQKSALIEWDKKIEKWKVKFEKQSLEIESKKDEIEQNLQRERSFLDRARDLYAYIGKDRTRSFTYNEAILTILKNAGKALLLKEIVNRIKSTDERHQYIEGTIRTSVRKMVLDGVVKRTGKGRKHLYWL